MKTNFIILFVALLCVMNPSTAVVVDVSKTHILVSDTNGNDRVKLKHAFAQILANNTGEQLLTILQNPLISEINISSGVKRSYFEKIDSKYLSNTHIEKYWFHVVMDRKFIQRVIAQAGFSLLPYNRDEIMLWVVKEGQLKSDNPTENLSDNLDFQIVNYAQTDEVLNYWLQQWADAMGLVIAMPRYDEIDMLLVTPDSIKNLSYEANEQSVKRYNKKQSLLLYIKQSMQGVKVRTGYVIDKNDMIIKHFQNRTDESVANNSDKESPKQSTFELGELLFTVMADVSNNYAQYFKIDSEDLENHTSRLVFVSIDDYDEISAIKQYLATLSMIKSYETVAASQGQLVLTVDLSISNESFLQIIERDNILEYNQNSPINQMVFSVVKNIHIEM